MMKMNNNRGQSVFDLHVHSHHSYDCKSNPKDIIKEAKRKKLEGIAITDHNTNKFHLENVVSKDLLIIPGIEISTNKGHVIALGIKEIIKAKQSVIETIETIRDNGGVTVIPHPFDFSRNGIGKELSKLDNVVIETQNASCPFQWFNTKAKRWAIENQLSETGGSDAHRIQDIGMAYTIVNQNIETTDGLLELIIKGETSSAGSHLSIFEKVIRAFQIHF